MTTRSIDMRRAADVLAFAFGGKTSILPRERVAAGVAAGAAFLLIFGLLTSRRLIERRDKYTTQRNFVPAEQTKQRLSFTEPVMKCHLHPSADAAGFCVECSDAPRAFSSNRFPRA